MKMPRKFTATAISALALALGVTTLQAPSASAADRTLRAPTVNPTVATKGQEVSFNFFTPRIGNSPAATQPGVGQIVFRRNGVEFLLAEWRLDTQSERSVIVSDENETGELCGISKWPAEGSYPAISARTCIPIDDSNVYARTPYLVPGANVVGVAEQVYPTADITMKASIAGELYPGERVLRREVTTSFLDGRSNGASGCSEGSEKQTVDATSAGIQTFIHQVTVPDGTVGQYLCMQQSIETSLMSQPFLSDTVIHEVISRPNSSAGVPTLNLGSALARLQEAARRLQQVQGQPNIDQAVLAAAAAEAEAARRQAEAAAAQAQARAAAAAAQGQAPPAGAPSAAQIAQVQQAAEAANAQVEQAIGQATAGTTKQTALSALAIATGFDPFTTPVLQAREKNASGVSIEVTAPKSIQQKKRLFTKLEVLDPVTRGGMRQYLLDLNGPTPRLLLKRSGFVPDGVENKRYWISKSFAPGTYGLLTTFVPSTPGIQGIAVYDTVEVTGAPTKKKKKKKRR